MLISIILKHKQETFKIMLNMFIIRIEIADDNYVTRHEKTSLCTKNIPTHIIACISFTVHDILNL